MIGFFVYEIHAESGVLVLFYLRGKKLLLHNYDEFKRSNVLIISFKSIKVILFS